MSSVKAASRHSFVHRALLPALALTAVLVSGAATGQSGPARLVAAPAAAPDTAAVPATDPLDGTIDRLAASAPGLPRNVLALAMVARQRAAASGFARRSDLVTVIDYSQPSTAKRLWVFDVANGKVLFNELVAHGKNTGDNVAQHFSNRDGSLQTSLGLFRTVGTYTGHNGYSLALDGLEPGFNDQAARRSVVMHGAPYVSAEFAAQHGRIGRSWGCPALSPAVAAKVIDTIKGGSLVFAYYPDRDWLSHSRFLGSSGSAAASTAVAR